MSSQTSAPPPAGISPQNNSALTSIALSLSMMAVGWAVTKGVVPAADQPVLANDLVLVVGLGVTAALGWYKRHQVSQASMITAVNADKSNGVKVVAETSPSRQVDAPIIPPAAK